MRHEGVSDGAAERFRGGAPLGEDRGQPAHGHQGAEEQGAASVCVAEDGAAALTEGALEDACQVRRQSLHRQCLDCTVGGKRGEPVSGKPETEHRITEGFLRARQEGAHVVARRRRGVGHAPLTGGGRSAGCNSPAASRLGTMTLRLKMQTRSPCWLKARVSTLTMPRSGLLDDSRLSSTVVSA